MGMMCAVEFQRHGRLYYADPGAYRRTVGDQVLYPTDDGPEVAEVHVGAAVGQRGRRRPAGLRGPGRRRSDLAGD